jgi:hypothetical protein
MFKIQKLFKLKNSDFKIVQIQKIFKSEKFSNLRSSNFNKQTSENKSKEKPQK